MDYGETFQLIRKGKNMTLKEAAGEILSVSQLSRFENGLSMVPGDLFHQLLQNINTTPQEFHFLLGEDVEKELKEFFLEVIEHIEQRDYQKLKEMRRRLDQQRSVSNNWQRFMAYFVDSLIQLEEDGEQQSQLPVQQYLMQVDDWGEMEL